MANNFASGRVDVFRMHDRPSGDLSLASGRVPQRYPGPPAPLNSFAGNARGVESLLEPNGL